MSQWHYSVLIGDFLSNFPKMKKIHSHFQDETNVAIRNKKTFLPKYCYVHTPIVEFWNEK